MAYEVGVGYLSLVPSLGNGFSGLLQGAGNDMQRTLGRAGEQAGEEAGGLFSGKFGKILKAGAIVGTVAALGKAAGAAFSSTFGEAMEREASTTKLSAQLGLSDSESKSLGATAGKLYAQAYGENFEGVTDAISVVKSSLKDLDGPALEGATKKALSFSQAFDVDLSRSVQSVSTLIGSGLVKDSTEAFDILTKSSQKVPAALREDVLDASDEYSQFFKSLGFNGAQAFGALAKASDKGVFGIDKTGDAIKEFTIRATDMSKTTMEAFGSIGLDSQKMANDILAGGETAQGATQQIVSGLLGIQDPATQANTALALFGTPLEDLGVSNIPTFLSSLQDATGGLGDFAGAADAVDKKLGNSTQAKWTSFTRTLAGFGPTLSQAFLPVVGPVLDGLTGIATKAQESMQSASDNITGFFAGFNKETDAELTENQKRWAAWGTDIRTQVQRGLNKIQGPLQVFQKQWDNFWGGLTTGFGSGAGPLGELGATLHDTLGDTFKELMSTGKQVFDAIGPPLIEAFKTIWDALKPLIPTFLQLFQAFNPIGLLFKSLLPILPQIASVFGDLAKTLAGGIARALTAIAPLFQKIVDVINRLMPFVTRLIQKLLPPFVALIDKLSPLLDAVLDALLPVVDAIIDALIPAIDAIMPIVERVFTFIADSVGNVIKVFSGIIDFITGVFTGDWDKAWQGIKEIFGAIWDQIKNVFSTLWDVLGEFFVNLLPKLGEILTGLRDKLWEWGSNFLGFIWQGIQDLWNNVLWPWFKGFPEMVWTLIKAAASQMLEWGSEFLQWLWDGITDKWEEVKTWFSEAPGKLWDFIQSGWQQVIQWGSDLISWIWQGTDGNGGIVGGAKAVFDWFLALPGNIWNAVKGAFQSASAWGAEMMKYFIEGISGSDPYVRAAFAKTMLNAASSLGISVDALAGFFGGVDVDGTIDDYLLKLQRQAVTRSPNYNYGGRGSVPGGARGAVVPGMDPGRRDNVLGWVPGFGAFGLRSQEAIMVPEFTSAVGGEAGVHKLNRLAEAGLLTTGFAGGGVIGGFGQYMGASFVKMILPTILDSMTKGIQSSSVVSNGQWGPGTDGSGLAANTQAARDFIVRKWGITDIGGVYGGSVPGSDHPIGKALDVMIANYLSAAGIAQGTSVADWFIQNPNTFGTKYVIWRDRINQNGAWAPYQHPSGSNDTLQHRDHVHLSFLTGSGQFQSGAAADDNPQKSGFLGALVSAVASKVGGLFGAVGGAGADVPQGEAVERWRPLGLSVLQKVGEYVHQSLTPFIGNMMNQIRTESGGNPNAVNDYDINARRGDPSIGLLQVIGSTFRAALSGTPFEYLIARGQRDPEASLVSSTLYSLARYKTLDRAWRGVAYRNGGITPDWGGGPDSVPAFLTPGEGVFTPPQTNAIITHAKALEAGWAGKMPVNLTVYLGDREITDIVRVEIDGVTDDAARELVRSGAQS